MALAVDSTSGNRVGGVPTHTYSHTCNGSDRILVVCVAAWNSPIGNCVVTGITYAGASLTAAQQRSDAGTGTAEVWYLIAPATGANNIIVSYAGTVNSSNVAAVSFTGAKQSGQPDAGNNVLPSVTTTGTNTFTTSADNCIRVDVAQTEAVTLSGVGGGQTNWYTSASGFVKASYKGPITPAASSSASFTTASNDKFAIAGISVAPLLTTVTPLYVHHRAQQGMQ